MAAKQSQPTYQIKFTLPYLNLTMVLIWIYTCEFNDLHPSASLHLVAHALLTFLEANLRVQSMCFNGRNSVMRTKEINKRDRSISFVCVI